MHWYTVPVKIKTPILFFAMNNRTFFSAKQVRNISEVKKKLHLNKLVFTEKRRENSRRKLGFNGESDLFLGEIFCAVIKIDFPIFQYMNVHECFLLNKICLFVLFICITASF